MGRPRSLAIGGAAEKVSGGGAHLHNGGSPARWVPGEGLLADAEADVFLLDVVVDAVVRAFAAEAGLFDAAEGRDFGGDQPFVDADHAVFQRLGHAPGAADVAGVQVGGEAEFGVVGHGDGLFFSAEAEHRGQRAEGFVARYQHGRGDVGQHGRLEEAAAEGVALTEKVPD